jgi:hypothetical protein
MSSITFKINNEHTNDQKYKMAPKIISTETSVRAHLADIDDIICTSFGKTPSNVSFCEEYHMMMDIVDVIYSSGVWSDDTFDNIMARFDTIVMNKKYLSVFRQCMTEVFHEKYKYLNE